jgi:hypothetical protein
MPQPKPRTINISDCTVDVQDTGNGIRFVFSNYKYTIKVNLHVGWPGTIAHKLWRWFRSHKTRAINELNHMERQMKGELE